MYILRRFKSTTKCNYLEDDGTVFRWLWNVYQQIDNPRNWNA